MKSLPSPKLDCDCDSIALLSSVVGCAFRFCNSANNSLVVFTFFVPRIKSILFFNDDNDIESKYCAPDCWWDCVELFELPIRLSTPFEPFFRPRFLAVCCVSTFALGDNVVAIFSCVFAEESLLNSDASYDQRKTYKKM